MSFTFSFNTSSSTLYLKGRLLEVSEAESMIKTIDQQIQEKKLNRLYMDLSDLEYINSSGLSVFLQLLTKMRKNGHDIFLKNISEKVNQLLIVTKLNAVFNIVKNETV